MQKICKILGVIVNIIGCIITGIVVWILGPSISNNSYLEALVKENMLATILIFIGVILLTMLPTVIVGVVLIGFGEMLEYQGYIAEKASQIGEKFDSVEKNDKKEGVNTHSNKGEWKKIEAKENQFCDTWWCPECARKNADDVEICACGFRKSSGIVQI